MWALLLTIGCSAIATEQTRATAQVNELGEFTMDSNSKDKNEVKVTDGDIRVARAVMGNGQTHMVHLAGKGDDDPKEKEEEANPADAAEGDPNQEDALSSGTLYKGPRHHTNPKIMFYVDPNEDAKKMKPDADFMMEAYIGMAVMGGLTLCYILIACTRAVEPPEDDSNKAREEYCEEVSKEILGEMFEIEDECPNVWPDIYGEATLRLCKYVDKKNQGTHTWAAWKELASTYMLLFVAYFLVAILFSVAYAAVGELREEKLHRVQQMEDTVSGVQGKLLEAPLNTWVNRDWAAFMDYEEVTGSGKDDIPHPAVWNLLADTKYCAKILEDIVPYWNAFGQWFMCATCGIFFIFYAKIIFELRNGFSMFMCLIQPTWPSSFEEHLDVGAQEFQTMCITKKEFKDGEHVNVTYIRGYTGSTKVILLIWIILPKIVITLGMAWVGTLYLLANSVSSELQELLISTIELGFVLEIDEIMFESFLNSMKKEELESAKLPKVKVTSRGAMCTALTEICLLCLCVGATFLVLILTYDARLGLKVHDQNVIEGCCNLENFLNGRGNWEIMRYANECREFREHYFEEAVEKGGWAAKWLRVSSHIEPSIAQR